MHRTSLVQACHGEGADTTGFGSRTNEPVHWCWLLVNPFTPKSDQCQISPAASPEMLHHTVWRTWLFVAYLDERLLYYQFSLPRLYIYLRKVGRTYFLSLGVKGSNKPQQKSRQHSTTNTKRRMRTRRVNKKIYYSARKDFTCTPVAIHYTGGNPLLSSYNERVFIAPNT